MMTSKLEISITSLKPVQAGGSSKGCMAKYYNDGYWYKEDSVGFESLAEVLSSRIARCTNAINPIVDYELVSLVYKSGAHHDGCRSKSFVDEHSYTQTAQRLAEASLREKDVSLTQIVGLLSSLYGQDMVDQLSSLLQLDRILINSDRHLNNVVILDNKDIVSFDYGDALGADVSYEFPMNMSAMDCIKSATAKPSLTSHDAQCMLMSFSSQFVLQAVSDTVIVSDIPACPALTRMCEIAQIQFKKYLDTSLKLI